MLNKRGGSGAKGSRTLPGGGAPLPDQMPDQTAICEEIEKARASGGRLVPFTDRIPGFDLDEAYRVAGMLACRRAARSGIVGRKIGFTNRALWEAAGLDRPVWGCMYEETVVASGDPIRMDGTLEPKIECEVVVRLRSVPEKGERGAAVARHVEAVGLGFEVVDPPYPGWKMRPADTVAAGGIHHALAVGPMIPTGDPEDTSARLAGLAVRMDRDGQHVADGEGRLVMGNPLIAVGVLAELAAASGQPLEAGEIITTGTLTPPLPCRAGEEYRAASMGDFLPSVKVALI